MNHIKLGKNLYNLKHVKKIMFREIVREPWFGNAFKTKCVDIHWNDLSFSGTDWGFSGTSNIDTFYNDEHPEEYNKLLELTNRS